MLSKVYHFIIITLVICSASVAVSAQFFDPQKGCVVDANKECLPNTNLTAMPFLRIAPDARGGAMGDAGIALSPTPASIHYNASALAWSNKDAALSATYTPWLQDLNLADVYLAQLSGFKKIDDLSAVGFQFKYFSLGLINFRDQQGGDNGDGKPREFQFGVAYARKLSDYLSASVTGNYLFSALAPGQVTNGIEITNATSFAADIGLTYKKPIQLGSSDAELTIGAAITNLGSKVTYTRDSLRDFIPTNLGIAGGLKLDLDEYNSLTFTVDFNKLLVPTSVSKSMLDDNGNVVPNPEFSKDGDNIADYRQKNLIDGVLQSFGDAQGGFREEMQEINYSIGAEYWYDNQFAARAGFFYEHPLKGARKFYTVGIGIKYNIFNIDLSYLVPGNNRRSPLDNTLRFGMIFDLGNMEALDE